ncbi:MAG: DUF1003 domain-containing protein [Actinobacteria bacterium]|nr:DUF1003 domain-containing protein [Actinomycetota bacterium]
MINDENPRICQLCKKHNKKTGLFPLELIDTALLEFIKEKYPECQEEGYICKNDLKNIRSEYVEEVLKKQKGELSILENKVFDSLKEQETIAKNVNLEFDKQLTIGERLSDRLAEFGGSWRFISIFFALLIIWVAVNSISLAGKNFDPYPFILLNLILSCLAAIQAPVIMMSQNRQESKDRLRARNDYLVNLKAELEIRNLNDKIDNLLVYQWQRLLEIQKIQMDIMSEISDKKKNFS